PPPPGQDGTPRMAAAEPVLMVAAALQSGRWHVPLPEFHARATELIGTFDQTIQPLYPEPVRQRAKYAVCATIDDIAQNLPGTPDGGTGWAQRNMVVTFFRENIGGDRFWDFVQEMLRDPAQNRDMIELFHACLAAGFEGRTRAMPDGGRKKQEVMASLLAGLDHVRSLSQQELVDHWRGEDRPRRPNNFWSLITTAAAAAAAIMFLVFTAFYLVLMVSGQEPERQVAALFPSEPVALNRAATEMPVPAVPAEMRLRQFLAAEIEQGLVEVQGNRIRTTIGTLFAPASDQLVDGRRPLFDKIGKAIELEKGPVTVEGHADSDRISGSIRFPNNIALSEARAQTVAGIIGASLSDKGRVKAVGLGDTVPLASNDTADGKARNRRVEIVLDNGF
ncbi:MAG TPA: type IVB secretion system protein IcmH/DotU, partial [Sphingopyxis sp.]|nr:type IVB secretion system protein IcmH/DotU [Sphingopyxis sp.]